MEKVKKNNIITFARADPIHIQGFHPGIPVIRGNLCNFNFQPTGLLNDKAVLLLNRCLFIYIYYS